jgi:hypothetical protein
MRLQNRDLEPDGESVPFSRQGGVKEESYATGKGGRELELCKGDADRKRGGRQGGVGLGNKVEVKRARGDKLGKPS